MFCGFGFGKPSNERGVGFIDDSHHDDRISGLLQVVARSGFMAAVRLATRTFIARAIEHDMAIEMSEFADVVVVFVARAVCRIEMLFVFIPQRIS